MINKYSYIFSYKKDSFKFYLHHHSTHLQVSPLLVKTGFALNLPPTPHDLNGNKDKIDDWKHIRRIPIEFDEHGFLVSNKFISYIK